MSGLPETFVPGFHDENEVRKMKYVKFGNTGMNVSELALGTATFSYFFGEYDFEKCKATVHEALKRGINYIDTAPFYGHGVSEEILGKCLEGIPRKAYYIATKVGRYEKEPKLMFDHSGKKTRESIGVSLKRLKLDYVDVLQIHDIEFAESVDIILNETLPALKEAQDQGKTRFIGITGYHTSELADCVKKSSVTVNTVLNYARLSLLDQKLKEYIPFFESRNMGIINAAPHCQSLLTNIGPQDWQLGGQELKNVCTEAREYCKKNGVELGKLALYYSLQEEGPYINLIGINTPEVLRINLDVYQNGLSDEEKEAYNHVRNNIFSKLKQGHWEGAEVAHYKKSIGAL